MHIEGSHGADQADRHADALGPNGCLRSPHNPKVIGSNPTLATKLFERWKDAARYLGNSGDRPVFVVSSCRFGHIDAGGSPIEAAGRPGRAGSTTKGGRDDRTRHQRQTTERRRAWRDPAAVDVAG